MRQKTSLTLFVPLSLLLVPLVALAGDGLGAGDRCELGSVLKIAARAGGKGKKRRLKKGDFLKIVSLEGEWNEVEAWNRRKCGDIFKISQQ